jgi:hypothetical protein
MRHLILTAALSAACTSETIGERVQVRWVLDQDTHAELETQTGFRVQLEDARLELASLYLYAPPSARLRAIAWIERSFVSLAHAHGGIDNEQGRRVLAEWTRPLNIDALAGSPVQLAETSAEGGTVDAVKLLLQEGVVAHVRGRAERAGEQWRFEAEVSPEAQVTRAVELIELEQTLEQDAVVHVRVQPKAWLDLCDFSQLGAASEDVVTVQAEDQVGRALSIGVRSPNAFEVYIEAEN